MCISALNCVKMLSNSERYLPKERGTLSVICVHSEIGTYCGIRSLSCA